MLRSLVGSEMCIRDRTNVIWQFNSVASGSGTSPGGEVTDGEFIVYLATGVTAVATQTGANCASNVWYRQVADSNGVLINPQGFTSL